MIEILILYIINSRSKTIYSIRKEIIELFGAFTKPSLGTIHPALKRLLDRNCVQVLDRMSDGGKKSSYYSITSDGKKYFVELFLTDISNNPSLFYNHLQARFATLGMLPVDKRSEFLDEVSKKIDLYQIELQDKLDDEFISHDFYQKELLKKMILEISNLKEFVQTIGSRHASNN